MRLLSQIAFLALALISSISTATAVRCEGVFANVASVARSGTVRVLFGKNQKPIKNYAEVLFATKPGDVLRFGDGEEFVVQKMLGFGETTIIFDIGDGWALRVPMYNGKQYVSYGSNTQSTTLLNDFINSYVGLKAAGIPVVEMDLTRSRHNKFAVVKKVDIKFMLSDMNSQNLSKKEREEIRKKLVEFAAKFWPVQYIGDFAPRQIAYTGTEWILLDYGVITKYISKFSNKRHIFEDKDYENEHGPDGTLRFADKATIKEISEAIVRKRKQAQKENAFIRDDYGSDDSDTGFIVNFPYKGSLEPGTILEAHRQSSYDPELPPPSEGASRLLKITEYVKDKKEFSLYEAHLLGGKPAYLVLKNEFNGDVQALDAKDVQSLFKKQIPDNAKVLAYGFDYVLFAK